MTIFQTSKLSADRLALTRAWFGLAIVAIGMAALFAILLLAMRLPVVAFDAAGWFNRALAAHVGLAALVWPLAALGGLWAMRGQRVGWFDWLAFALLVVGALAMLASPFAAGRAYAVGFPVVLDNPVFFAGLILSGAAVVGAGLLALRPGLAGPCIDRSLERASMFAVFAAVAAALASIWLTPAGLPRHQFIEVAGLGSGHALQFAHVAILLLAWTALARDAGLILAAGGDGGARDRRVLAVVALLAILPILVLPRLYLGLPESHAEFRQQLAMLMGWASWPAPVVLAGFVLARWRRASGPGGNGSACTVLLVSMLLFGLGGLFGALPEHFSTRLAPARLHATLGAMSVALMGLVYRFGQHDRDGDWAASARPRMQWLLYGSGTAVFCLGLVWAGRLDMPGKSPAGASAGLAGGAEAMLASALMAIGGVLASLVVAMFVWRAGRLRAAPGPADPDGRARRRSAAVLAVPVALTLAGVTLAWLPEAPSVVEDMASHARQSRAEEIRQRFDRGVSLLNRREYEHAMTAFHRVLELSPTMPEAHVNMGFALLGAQRYKAARDFFESASRLRASQSNAYYGLAMALAGLDDLPGAIGAMRIYIERTARDDPYLANANALLSTWQASTAR